MTATATSQTMEALQNANRVRYARAAVKRKIAAGKFNPLEVIQEPTELIKGMGIRELLMSVPLLGKHKVDRALTKAGIFPNKPIGELTERQVWRLDEVLSSSGTTQNPWCRALSR